MCLIDPQSHLYVIGYLSLQHTHKHDSSELSLMNRLYWDRGPKAIEHFLGHHFKDCANNVICNAFSLMMVKFEDSDGDVPSTSKHFKSVSPQKLCSHSQDKHAELVANKPLHIGA